MADKKISELSAIASLASSDVIPVDQGGVAFKVTVEELLASAPILALRDTARGLIITVNAAHPEYQVDIVADEIILQNTSGTPLRLLEVDETVDLEASGLNGLDTGAEANVWYYLWVISNGSTSGGLISASASSPTLPSGYTYKALVGAFRNSTDIQYFYQRNNYVRIGATNVVLNGSETNITEVSLSGAIPATAIMVDGQIEIQSSAASAIAYISCNAAEQARSEFNTVHTGSTASNLKIQFNVLITVAQKMYYKIEAGTTCNINIEGYRL